jgi:hypothetical protein
MESPLWGCLVQGLHPSFDAYNRGEKSRTKNKPREELVKNDSAALREHGRCLAQEINASPSSII